MKVSDIMQADVDYVSPDTSLLEVARHIFGHGINGLPVCENKKVIGFITERDILAKFYPKIQDYMEDPVHEGDFEAMENKISEILRISAKDIMSKNPVTITADTPLLRAQSLMFVHKVGRLPVIDDQGILIGILSKGDIFRSVVGQRLPFEQDEQFHDWLSRRYDRIIDWEARLAKEIPDLTRLFKKEKVKTVLDVGCGTGVHAIALAKEGFHVVGIDMSPRMIREAKHKTKTASSRVKQRVQFINHAYQDLEKVFGEKKFDAAIFMGTGLAHQPSPQEVLVEANKVLAEKTVIVCQITNFDKVIKVNKRLFDFHVREFPFSPEKEHAFLRFYDPEKEGRLNYNVSVFEKGRNWTYKGMHSTTIFPLDRKNMSEYLKDLNFKTISFYGGEKGFYYDYLFRKSFKPMQSDVLIVAAKR